MRFIIAALSWGVLSSLMGACSERGSRAPAEGSSDRATPIASDRPEADRRARDLRMTYRGVLANRLREESGARPDVTPSAESVLAALASAGIEVKDVKQYLAATVHASYCLGGRTAAGLAVAVCEYPDAEAAARGRSYSLERFRAVAPGRDVLLNGENTLTLTIPPGGGVEARQEAGAVRAIFRAGGRDR